jgi:hypothetical protein
MTVQLEARPLSSDPVTRPASALQAVVSGSRWRRAGLTAAFAALATPYLIAVASPLRLSPDSVAYLSLADRIPDLPGHQAYPPGFPLLLRLAEGVGLGSAWGFVAMNLIFLAIAVGAVSRLCREPLGLTATGAALVCVLVLLAQTVIQLTPTVLSDVPYFAVAMVCLLALSRAGHGSTTPRAALLIAGGVLAAAAISIRIEGLALIPPVLVAAAGPDKVASLWHRGRRRPARAIALAATALLALIASTVLVARATGYAWNLARAWPLSRGPGFVAHNAIVGMKTKLSSLGLLVTQGWHAGALVLVAAGVGLLALCVVGLLSHRRLGPIELFVISTAAIILVYRGAVPRFWLAAVPFMIVYTGFGLQRFARSLGLATPATALYVIAFAVAGGVWLGRSIAISTSGRRFPQVWATQIRGRSVAAAYRVAFGEARPRDALAARPAAIELLRHYEPLARSRAETGG